ncbi:MAG: HAMP domain-containing protein, partial [Vallitaleaceae bacterium]|nr:HAMP domain-containing protein [Vallitaleaceae bacterium]
KRSIQKQLIASFVVLVLVISIFSNYQSYRVNYRYYIMDIRNQVERIAAGAAMLINGDIHETFTDPSAQSTPEFQMMFQQLKQYQEETEMTYVYTLTRLSDGATQFIIDASDEPAELGYEYDFLNGMQGAFDGVISSDEEVYTDEWGTFLSGYAPITNSQGQVVAIIGVDIEASELASRRSEFLLMAVLQTILSLFFAFVIGFFLAKRIAKPILELKNKLRNLSENGGNLTQRIDIHTKDELEDLGNSVNAFICNVREIVTNIILFAEKVSKASYDFDQSVEENRKAIEEVATSIMSIANGASDQAMYIKEVSDNIEGITDSINENEHMIHSINDYASGAKNHIENGIEAIRHQGLKTEENIRAFQKVIEVVNHLAQEANEVEQIVDSITNIAKQTNLLSLNAAIEAARAGEHGKGFSVVAEEVRKLAEESNQSAAEIGEIIQRITKDTQAVLIEIKNADQSTSEQKRAVEETNTTYQTMAEEMNNMIDGVHRINTSFVAIVEKTNQTNKKVQEIAVVSQDNAAISQELSASTEEESAVMDTIANNARILHDLSVALKNSVDKFTV